MKTIHFIFVYVILNSNNLRRAFILKRFIRKSFIRKIFRVNLNLNTLKEINKILRELWKKPILYLVSLKYKISCFVSSEIGHLEIKIKHLKLNFQRLKSFHLFYHFCIRIQK